MSNISGIVKSARKIMRQDIGTGSDELKIKGTLPFVVEKVNLLIKKGSVPYFTIAARIIIN